MSTRELRRAGVWARVAAGRLQLRSAATLMEVSYRQAKRLYRRYRREGATGLKHRNAGRLSNRATPTAVRERAVALIREQYSRGVDERFGPTLAAEHLASEDGVTVDHETLRRWMLAAGLWSRARKRSPHRRRRERYIDVEPLKSRKTAISQLRVLGSALGPLPVKALERPDAIEDFKARRSGRAIATTNRYLARLRHVCNWAIGRELALRRSIVAVSGSSRKTSGAAIDASAKPKNSSCSTPASSGTNSRVETPS